MTPPPFFRGISGGRTNGKQGKCSHTCYFCIPAGCKNACWGASPNPALGLVSTNSAMLLWDKMSQKSARSVVPHLPTKSCDFAGHPMPKVICLRHCALSLLFLFALAVRDAQQMVNVGLDRHGLPHFLLRRAVLGIERLFLRRQLAAFFF